MTFLFTLTEECGVKYSHSNRRLFGTNAAEDKMSSKAIKDVFWLGLNSQEPAHNVDISVGI